MFASKANQPLFAAEVAKEASPGCDVYHSTVFLLPASDWESVSPDALLKELRSLGIDVVFDDGMTEPTLHGIQLVIIPQTANGARVRVVGRLARRLEVKMIFPSSEAIASTARRELNC